MQYSKNLKLNLPERNDQYNLDHWNENTNNLDELVYQNQLDVSQNKNDISKIFNGLDTKNVNDINSVYYKLMKLVYPVGSLYWSSNNTNPSQLFGGTWSQIKDKFILSAGDTYKNNDIGGSATVTLTVNQIPSHTHTGPSHTHSFTPSGTVSSHRHTMSHTHTFTTASSGSHNHRALVYTGEVRQGIEYMYAHNSNSDHIGNYWCIAGQSSDSPWDAPDDTSVVNTTDNKTAGYARYANWGSKRNNSYKREIIESAGAHTHTGTTNEASSSKTVEATPTFTGTAGTTGPAGTGNTGATGSSQSHNNMPPYIVKYCWERTN